ncbi:NHL repeat-containing protein [Kineococcus xinjiangensis]|uniref:NHL repeat-containing protein n=1 Tax=Kineococcus xinjiangensis TaxID=512762 RepID=A0A2S6IJ30_9ACTN|nr:cell wall-binding repeat-containing protein [Kineococcus xinjiangensis]PPK94208.1 NHL repeat-containing protein [Kineococcus xinjiangensis]
MTSDTTASRAVRRPRRRAAAWLIALAAPALAFAGAVPAQASGSGYTVTVRAGTGTAEALVGPSGVASDAAGNLYIADTADHRVWKLSRGGTLSAVAGDGTQGPSVAGPATASPLSSPAGVAVDAAGTVYIADTGNHRVLRVTSSGALTFLAGTGVAGAPQPGTAATSPLSSPGGVAVDAVGAVYIADTGNNQVEKVTGTTLSVVAGTGRAAAPVPGAATASPLSAPSGVAVDALGDLFIADRGNHRIEKVTVAGVLSVVAGTGTAGAATAGAALSSPLSSPTGVAVDAGGNLFIADRGNHRVEKVAPTGSLSLVAGTGTAGAATAGAALSAPLDAPGGVAVDREERVYVATAGTSPQVVELTSTAAATGPHVTSAAPPVAAVGAAYSHRFTATGFPTPSWTVLGTLPAGMVFNGSTGVLSGAPTTKGSTTFTVRATNSTGHDDQIVTLVVGTPPGAPAKPTAVDAPAGVTLTWTAPTAAGDSPVTGYSVIPHRAGTAGTPVVFTSTATTQKVTGLEAGASYTFTVAAVNSFGTGAASPASDAVVPAPSGGAVVPPAAGLHRFDGADRVATSVRVSKALFPAAGSARAVVVATSTSYADALGGARLASASAAPLLLTGTGTLQADVAAEVKRLLAEDGTVYVLGGPGALSAPVESALKALSAKYVVKRLSGGDRYATSIAIADAVAAPATAPIYLASGTAYPDGLAVSALAARTGGVVVLTEGPVMPTATRAYLEKHDPTGARTVPVGGPAAAAAAQLPTAAAIAPRALVGADRYDTARLVAERFVTAPAPGSPTPAPVKVVGLAPGQNWPDALVGSAAMGNLAGPLLLNIGDTLQPATKTALTTLTKGGAVSTGVVFGGRDALNEGAATAFDAMVPDPK